GTRTLGPQTRSLASDLLPLGTGSLGPRLRSARGVLVGSRVRWRDAQPWLLGPNSVIEVPGLVPSVAGARRLPNPRLAAPAWLGCASLRAELRVVCFVRRAGLPRLPHFAESRPVVPR